MVFTFHYQYQNFLEKKASRWYETNSCENYDIEKCLKQTVLIYILRNDNLNRLSEVYKPCYKYRMFITLLDADNNYKRQQKILKIQERC